MKIFFTASLRGQAEFGTYYKEIFWLIEKTGAKNLDDEILKLSKDYYGTIQEQGRAACVNLYQRKIKSLQQADICIFEGSVPSLSIGYLIDKALDFNKPTIILYYKSSTPQFISGIEGGKIVLKQYLANTLQKSFESALEEAKHLQDKRFNFFISPDLLNYLERASKEIGITKSTFIRNLILQHKKKHS